MTETTKTSDTVPVVVVTRLSYLGQSGWKIPADDQKKILFDAERLGDRLNLFRSIAVASLAMQRNRSFHHYILTSQSLPDWAKKELEEICLASYGSDGFTIDYRRPGQARRFLQLFLEERYGTSPVAQVVLDDDDGLACDFMDDMTALVDSYIKSDSGSLPHFFSWSLGYGLVFDGNKRPALYQHRYRFINLGLTILARPQEKNILAIDHRNAPRRFGATVEANKPMFVRSLHPHNDSRVAVSEKWMEVLNWPDDAEIGARFPFLKVLADIT